MSGCARLASATSAASSRVRTGGGGTNAAASAALEGVVHGWDSSSESSSAPPSGPPSGPALATPGPPADALVHGLTAGAVVGS
jgi:hypothetical protein